MIYPVLITMSTIAFQSILATPIVATPSDNPGNAVASHIVTTGSSASTSTQAAGHASTMYNGPVGTHPSGRSDSHPGIDIPGAVRITNGRRDGERDVDTSGTSPNSGSTGISPNSGSTGISPNSGSTGISPNDGDGSTLGQGNASDFDGLQQGPPPS